ncbi:MAG: DUF1493 family protein [Pirellulaceae bacterium]
MRDIEQRVVAFVARQCGVDAEKLRPHTTLFGDLRVDGDDGMELLERFGGEFSVDLSHCDSSRHFGSEGFAPWTPVYWLVLALRRVGKRCQEPFNRLNAPRTPKNTEKRFLTPLFFPKERAGGAEAAGGVTCRFAS